MGYLDESPQMKKMQTGRKHNIKQYTNISATESNYPVVSIVVPLYNQEKQIANIIRNIFLNTSVTSEIILIDDASTDESLNVVLETLKNMDFNSSNVKDYTVISSKRTLFETKCDALGISNSRGLYILEIQADMLITEYGFDRKMLNIVQQNPDIFAVSGRGIMTFAEIYENYEKTQGAEASISRSIVHSIYRRMNAKKIPINNKQENSTSDSNVLFNPNQEEFLKMGNAGRLGRAIDLEMSHTALLDKFLYVGETVMRGPLFFEKARYESLGGFDSRSFFLGFDEHDLFLRARKEFGWKSAYVPIGFFSPLSNGSMRRKRSLKTKFNLWRNTKRVSRNRIKSALFCFHPSQIIESAFEIRKFTLGQ
jgi:glycosyltransferase involved in cell wall biosynthesis